MKLRSLHVAAMSITAVALLGLAGCENGDSMDDGMTSQPASMGVINTTCPVMSDHEVSETAEPVNYMGHKIGFCCDGCQGKFAGWSEEQKQAYVQAQMNN